MEKPAADDTVWVCVSKARLSDDERKALLGDEEEPREHVRGRVVGSAKANERRVRVKDGMELVVHTDHLVPANPDIQDGVDDVAQLSHLNEPSLLHHIASRYLDKELIYTRAGPVLVAMNPFMRLPELYADAQLATYQKFTAISAGADSDGPRDEPAPPPHVYEVAGVVYNSLRLRGASQSVVINGESGSGKTETTKIILRFLTHQSGGDEISRKLHRAPPTRALEPVLPADSPPSRPPPVRRVVVAAPSPCHRLQPSARVVRQLRHAAQPQLVALRQVCSAALLVRGDAERRFRAPLPAREEPRGVAGGERALLPRLLPALRRSNDDRRGTSQLATQPNPPSQPNPPTHPAACRRRIAVAHLCAA